MQVQHDTECQFMRFQWAGGPDNHYLRAGMAHGRDRVVFHRPVRVLLDFTNLPPISLMDELWMSVHWFPKVAGPPLQYVAMIFAREQVHNQMASEAILRVGRHLFNFQLQFFEEATAALDWLIEGNRTAARQLQAEWNAAWPHSPL